jgi:hypothetical protein
MRTCDVSGAKSRPVAFMGVGLLDDAIREHLDLKRRRGGDPAEIERAEREALGPVRRNRDPGGSGDPEAPVEAEYAPPDSAYEEPDEGVASDLVDERGPVGDAAEVDEAPFDDDPFAEEQSLAAEAPAVSEPSGASDEPFLEREPDPEPSSETDADGEPKTRVMRAADIPALSDATAEYDVDDALAEESAEEPDAEDVLEETPEFLQDTPDHDRLWFEQRPPKDFDFDG